jgi:hypothetical protein
MPGTYFMEYDILRFWNGGVIGDTVRQVIAEVLCMAEAGYKNKKKAKQFFHERGLMDEIKDCSLVAASVLIVLMKSCFLIKGNCAFSDFI